MVQLFLHAVLFFFVKAKALIETNQKLRMVLFEHTYDERQRSALLSRIASGFFGDGIPVQGSRKIAYGCAVDGLSIGIRVIKVYSSRIFSEINLSSA